MCIISNVVRKTRGVERLPKRYLVTDLRRLTVLVLTVTPANEVSGDPWKADAVVEGPELSGSHSHATTGQYFSGRVQGTGASPVPNERFHRRGPKTRLRSRQSQDLL